MLNRRQFVHVAAAGVTAAGASVTLLRPTVVRAAADAAAVLRTLSHPDLLAVLGPDAVREIGRRYRALVPAEHDGPSLVAALGARRTTSRAAVAELVGRDFAAGRTIVVCGWVLSATEARQCALFFLGAT